MPSGSSRPGSRSMRFIRKHPDEYRQGERRNQAALGRETCPLRRCRPFRRRFRRRPATWSACWSTICGQRARTEKQKVRPSNTDQNIESTLIAIGLPAHWFQPHSPLASLHTCRFCKVVGNVIAGRFGPVSAFSCHVGFSILYVGLRCASGSPKRPSAA